MQFGYNDIGIKFKVRTVFKSKVIFIIEKHAPWVWLLVRSFLSILNPSISMFSLLIELSNAVLEIAAMSRFWIVKNDSMSWTREKLKAFREFTL